MTEPTLSGTALLELREHFENPEQQRETASIGMWVFLITEVMMFGALFTGFTVYRLSNPAAFDEGSKEMTIVLGAVNTALLILSSFTMSLGTYFCSIGKTRLLSYFLILTMVIGAVFIGIKFTEYYLHWQDHKVPGFWFEYHGADARAVQMFYVFYFILTGLHVVHMTIGIGILLVMLWRNLLGSFSATYHTPVDLAGVYWSFVDIIWIFLFAIFYIPGLHLR
ncbi:MAG TPA: cytochrome c oxidase subunit 3 [Bryobacteraceae bacterium]|jgi:cytochrome c oxidase subunit 3|nr:cytochrome c oxidase subunit 3 [Bryobacteraceae bacterium]